jgi:serine protease inhibitor
MHPYRNLALAFVALSVIACRSATDVPQQQPELKALPRALSASEIQVSSSANRFSFSLFRQVNSDQADKNVFISPISASMALGMTMNGAAGTTFEQMRSALALGDADQDAINGGYKGLIGLLGGLDQTTTFSLANSIWYRQEFPFEQTFLDAGKTWFDADVRGLDFSSPSALPTINGWVNDKTSGKIPTILDRIDGDQVMFLINAIYFKGSWRTRFDPSHTVTAPFHSVGGDQSAKLMRREGTMRWLQTADFEAVDLPYGNGAYSMTVVLPATGKRVDDVAASLQPSAWKTWMGQFTDAEVELQLPRFKLEWERKLIPDLQVLGMRAAFIDGGADFSRMTTPGSQLYISLVKQKTYVDVNEEGTEAAAVTNVGVAVTSLPVRRPFIVDRPFIFVLRERLSGTILFVGKITRLP